MRWCSSIFLWFIFVSCAEAVVTPPPVATEVAVVMTMTPQVATPTQTPTAPSERVRVVGNSGTVHATPMIDDVVISAEHQPRETTPPTKQPTASAATTPDPTATPPIMLYETRPSIDAIKAALTSFNKYGGQIGNFTGANSTLELADLNGDGKLDLVASDHLFVAIFLRVDSAYRLSYVKQASGKYSPTSRYQLQDWTGDGHPELVFDHKTDIGGSGIYYYRLIRNVIHCSLTDCAEVLQIPMVDHVHESNLGGQARQTATTQLVQDEKSAEVTINFAGYTFYNDGFYMPLVDSTRIRTFQTYTATQVAYTWTGQTFEPDNHTVTSPAQVITASVTLSATDKLSNVATLTLTPQNIPLTWNSRDAFCQLHVNHVAIGERLSCKENFATVAWRNVVGHSREELIVRVWASAYDETGANATAGFNCSHERLLIYQLVGVKLVEIANVTSCLLLPQIEQIQLADLQLDGEIALIRPKRHREEQCPLTQQPKSEYNWPPCWREETLRYDLFRWNGTRFAVEHANLLPNQLQVPSRIEQLLSQFPMEVGMSRTYSVTYETGLYRDEVYAPVVWRGVVTERVVQKTPLDDGYIFKTVLDRLPIGINADGVAFEERVVNTYVVDSEGIQRNGVWILKHPLQAGDSFAVFDDLYDPNRPCWYGYCVRSTGVSRVPAGWFTDCFALTMYTGPDTTMRTICEGVGVTQWISWHHGARDNYVWRLARIDFP